MRWCNPILKENTITANPRLDTTLLDKINKNTHIIDTSHQNIKKKYTPKIEIDKIEIEKGVHTGSQRNNYTSNSYKIIRIRH